MPAFLPGKDGPAGSGYGMTDSGKVGSADSFNPLLLESRWLAICSNSPLEDDAAASGGLKEERAHGKVYIDKGRIFE